MGLSHTDSSQEVHQVKAAPSAPLPWEGLWPAKKGRGAWPWPPVLALPPHKGGTLPPASKAPERLLPPQTESTIDVPPFPPNRPPPCEAGTRLPLSGGGIIGTASPFCATAAQGGPQGAPPYCPAFNKEPLPPPHGPFPPHRPAPGDGWRWAACTRIWSPVAALPSRVKVPPQLLDGWGPGSGRQAVLGCGRTCPSSWEGRGTGPSSGRPPHCGR